MQPTSRITFSWVGRYGKQVVVNTVGMYFKYKAIELLEKALEENLEIHYTVDDGDKILLDYYNTSL